MQVSKLNEMFMLLEQVYIQMVTFHVAHFLDNQWRLSVTFLNLRQATYTSRFSQIYSSGYNKYV